MDNYISDCIIVSVDFSEEDVGVLIVGRKAKGKDIDIINAFSGKEARDIYDRLVTRKEKEDK